MKNSEKMLMTIATCQLCHGQVESVRLATAKDGDKEAIYRCHGAEDRVKFDLEDLADPLCTGTGNEIMRMLMSPFATRKSDG